MREILFRGKRSDNGKWVYGYYVHVPCGRFEHEEHLIQEIKNNGKFGVLHSVDPSTVGQFIGRTDRNGRPIFEADVFEWGYAGVKELRYVTVYDVQLAAFVGERHLGVVYLNGVDIEIIGNIHDNPELLEGGAEGE